MHARPVFLRKRFVNSLLLFILIFSSLGISPAGAAPVGQTTEPPLAASGIQQPAAPGDHLVTGLTIYPQNPNILGFNENVTILFNYSTTDPGGVRIFARPFTDGALTPNYAASGSPLYPQSATGSGSATFTITSGQVLVDQIRFQMYNADQSVLYFETFVPVHYLFVDNNADRVNIVTYTPQPHNVMVFNQYVNLYLNYHTSQANGVYITLTPFTNGKPSRNAVLADTGIFPGNGVEAYGSFTITSGRKVVDQIRVQMLDSTKTTVLFEAFMPVYYRYDNGNNTIYNLTLRFDSPNIFKYNQTINVTFNYSTTENSDVFIDIRPFTGAHTSPNATYPALTAYPPASGSSNVSFSLSAGPLAVDRIRLRMWNAAQTRLLFEAFIPVYLFWAGSGPPPGPDMHVDAIEVTQTIQDLNNSVDLVAGKKTFVRVHTSAPVNVANISAKLNGRRGWWPFFYSLTPGNPGAAITIKTFPDRGQLNDSFWFELPSGWTSAGSVTLSARIDPNNITNDTNLANNFKAVTVNFQNTPPLRLRIFDVQYTVGANTFQAANTHMDKLESWLRRAYPISSLQVTRQSFTYPSAGLPNVDTLNAWLVFGKIIRMIFTGEDGRTVYYGMVDDGGGFIRGKAMDIPGVIASGPTGTGDWGWDYDGSYGDWYGGHEIGHTRNRYHAMFCGAAAGAAYPYPNGRISPDLSGNGAIYGFDVGNKAIYSPSWSDVMTYCSNEWMSDFTYEGIRSYLVGQGFAPSATTAVTATQFLALQGFADLNAHTASLDNVYLVNQTQTLSLPTPGDWTIALVNASNQDLATYPFAPDLLTDQEQGAAKAIIGEVVPWVDGAVRVEIRFGGQVKASRTASANPPGVTINSPASGSVIPAGPFTVSWTGTDPDGDPLTYTLLYSYDGGLSWQTLATSLTASSLQLTTDKLPGGSSAQFKVVASDGFLTAQDTVTGLTLPLHPPAAQILQPSEGQVFHPTQPVTLEGTAYDLEDGTLGDEAYSWTSSLDGDLGVGASLNTAELSTGTHVITLTATDSDGMTGVVTRTITIAEENTPVSMDMQLSPPLGEVVEFGSPPITSTLSVRSGSATEVNWTASVNVPWLKLNVSSGTTPSDIVATIDPKGLGARTYTGKVTFTSTQAVNSPKETTVTLQVVGPTAFMPIISK